MAYLILLQHHLSLEEDALGSATVDFLGFIDGDGVVFEVVEDDDLADAVVLKSAFDNALLEITEKSEDLYNKYLYFS
jgi:hypothetical protein